MDRKPNIVLINCDDLGYGDLSCYGSTKNKTPAIDRLAREGISFTDFYMASPVCSPSRGAMLTGCYPPRISFGTFEGRWVLYPGDPVGLNPSETTMGSLLKGQGYRTKIVGKWHCGDQPEFLPTKHGFDSYYGIPYSNDMGIQAGSKREYPPLPLLRDDGVIQQQPDQASITERYVEEAIRFIRDSGDDPFFLYFAHMYVHLPLYVQDTFLKKSQNGAYGAAVEAIDWATSAIVHELADRGLEEDTLIIFTSDNGSRNGDEGGSNGPLRGTKGTTWEGGQRVPCIMRWSNHIPPNQVHKGIATSMDLLPTFAALSGASMPDDRIIDGADISEVILGTHPDHEVHDKFFYYLRDNLEAVRLGKWKLHVYRAGREKWGVRETEPTTIRELYDLENDIGETTNVAKSHPEVVERIMEEVEACRSDLGDEATQRRGNNTRPKGRAERPDTLTHFDENHPYIIAMYDIEDHG